MHLQVAADELKNMFREILNNELKRRMGGKPLLHLRRIFSEKPFPVFGYSRGSGGGPGWQYPPPVWRNWSGTERDKSGTTRSYMMVGNKIRRKQRNYIMC